MSEGRVTYTFGPLERRGILGPIRAGQAGSLAASVLGAIAALDASPTPAGALAALALVALGAAGAFAPFGGRTVQEWLPIGVAFAGRRLRGGARFASPAAAVGAIARGRAVASEPWRARCHGRPPSCRASRSSVPPTGSGRSGPSRSGRGDG